MKGRCQHCSYALKKLNDKWNGASPRHHGAWSQFTVINIYGAGPNIWDYISLEIIAHILRRFSHGFGLISYVWNDVYINNKRYCNA